MKKVSLVLTCILFINANSNPINKVPEYKPLTKENVWNAIIDSEIKFPEVVFAQAMLESRELKSPLAENNKNIFGMKLPVKRSTTAINNSKENIEKGAYAKYEHWIHSVEDYKLYQDYILGRRSISTVPAYVSFLNRSYAEVGDYDKRLGRVIREHRSLLESYK